MKILIATATVPLGEDNFREICSMMRSAVAQHGCEIPPGIYWTHGRGCANLAFEFKGPDADAEQFAKELTMVLMPSKWCTTSDPLPSADTCDVIPTM